MCCYTSCSEHVSIVIDQVTLLIILNTPGSLPSLAPLEGGQVGSWVPASPASPPSSPPSPPHNRQNQARTRHSFIQRGGGPDRTTAEGTTFGPFRNPHQGHGGGNCKFIPAKGTGPQHSVCYRRKTWQHIFRKRALVITASRNTNVAGIQ